MTENVMQPVRDVLGTTCSTLGQAFHTMADACSRPANGCSIYYGGYYPTYSYTPLFGCYPQQFFYGRPWHPMMPIFDDTSCLMMPSFGVPSFQYQYSAPQVISAPTVSLLDIQVPTTQQTQNYAMPSTLGYRTRQPFEIFDDDISFGYNPMSYTPSPQQPMQYQQGQSGNTYTQNPYGMNMPVSSMSVDQILHPAKYQQMQNTNPTTNNNTQNPQSREAAQEEVRTTYENAGTAGLQLTEYYNGLASRKEEGKNLSPAEEKIYQQYKTLINKYSPFEKDEQGKPKTNSATGNLIPTALYSKMVKLHNLLDTRQNEQAEKLIRSITDPNELAAIEFYWDTLPKTTDPNCQEKLNSKPFRAMLKESYMNWATYWWSAWNDSDFESLLEYIDNKVLSISPKSIALSFDQYINNCHQWGTGIDRTNVIRLLDFIKGNKELIKAVNAEYSTIHNGDDLQSAITTKLFVTQGSETAQKAVEVLGT